MNYLAHALGCLDDPYETAGVATPDWLGMTRPRLRCRSRQAVPYVASDDEELASLARGVTRHHADDLWFHQTTAFLELSIELAQSVRWATGDCDGARPGFLGHILVELLLDDAIIAEDPAAVDGYYAILQEVAPARVAAAVSHMTGCDAAALSGIITRFCELRFLYDYGDDERLAFRLNQVLRRVRLPELPARFVELLPEARRLVASRRVELLTPPPARRDLLAPALPA